MRLLGSVANAVAGLAAALLMLWLPAMGWPMVVALILALMRWTPSGRQAAAVTWTGLSTLPRRLGSASVIVLGIAGVVAVMVSLLAMGEGLRQTMRQTGSDDTVILLRAGSRTEINSVIERGTVALLTQQPGLATEAEATGTPLAAPQLNVMAAIRKKGTQTDSNVAVRGVGATMPGVFPDVRLVEGRMFEPGLRELVAGRGAMNQFDGVDVGSTLQLNGQVWRVVGAFESGGAFDSELWGDVEAVASAYRRGSVRSSVMARLDRAPGSLQRLRDAVASDPRLKVDVETTRAYFSAQSEKLTTLIRVLGTSVAIIMGVGAVFGALNTMHAAVSTRATEIATLRAIGFRGQPVAVSVLMEAMVLAALGGLLGAWLAWWWFDGFSVSSIGSNFTQVVFAFRITPDLVGQGLAASLAMGLLGGWFPASHAARQNLGEALRDQ